MSGYSFSSYLIIEIELDATGSIIAKGKSTATNIEGV